MKRNIFSFLCTASLAIATSSACKDATIRHATQDYAAESRRTNTPIKHNAETTQQVANDSHKSAKRQWKAGAEISTEDIEAYGINHCFSTHTIDDELFSRICGKSFKADCTVPRTDLRYLHILHHTADGKTLLGEMVCHKDIADDLLDIFRQLYVAHYPIERMQLIDNYAADDIRSMEANNTTCFNFRNVAGSKKLSNHSLGKAVDLNPLYNPYVKRSADGTIKVSPESGREYSNRTKAFKYKIDHNDFAYRLFKQHGFRWGGDYRSLKDYQHFEKP